MTYLEDGPEGSGPGSVGGGGVLGVFHFVGKDEEVGLDVAEAGGRRFALGGVADGWHCDGMG